MFEGYFGQKHLVSEGKPIYKMVENNNLYSLILYGPPGIGKTKLANIIADSFKTTRFTLNAAICSLDEIKEAVKHCSLANSIIIIFDEIHRLDKKKQNFLLPYVENQSIYIIGTTTENPYISVNNALRSRVIIFELFNLERLDVLEALKYHNDQLPIDVYEQIYKSSAGDIRMSLNILDFFLQNYNIEEITSSNIKEVFKNNINYEHKETLYYDLLSALQKSIRGSDLDAALYYLARLLEVKSYDALLRRLRVISYEDVSLASPITNMRVSIALDGFEKIGMPEGRILLANAVCEMCLAPKSPSAYQALDEAIHDVRNSVNINIPEHIRYKQPTHNQYSREKTAKIDNLPDNLKGKNYLKNYGSSNTENALYQNYLNRNKLKKENK